MLTRNNFKALSNLMSGPVAFVGETTCMLTRHQIHYEFFRKGLYGDTDFINHVEKVCRDYVEEFRSSPEPTLNKILASYFSKNLCA